MGKLSFTAIDLFSGAGGLTLGLKQAGYRVLAAVELDGTACESYALNHPKVKLIQSRIETVCGDELLDDLRLEVGELDLLAGCPPCQGFSRIRTKNGTHSSDDPRNLLVGQVSRLVVALMPKAIMLENVPGLAASAVFADFTTLLSELGYSFKSSLLNASTFGVPQRRRRLVLWASRVGEISSDFAEQKKTTVREVFRGLPTAGSSGDELHDCAERRSEKVKRLISLIPKDGGGRRDLPDDLKLQCHKNFGGFSDVYGRMSWDDVAPTITTGCSNPSKGRFLHPEENRTITLREAALLQTFPRKYMFSMRRGKEDVARQIGNAFPPKMIRAIAAPENLGLIN